MLNLAVRNTKKLIRQKSAEEKVRIGRFFTKRDTARLMADSLVCVQKSAVYVLDAGAGTGILAAAAVEAVCRAGGVGEIFLTCYENNPTYLPMLENNLERVRKKARHDYHVKVRVTVREENFLLADHPEDERYDYILINPPHELAAEGSEEEKLRPEIFPAANVSLDCLFVAVAAELLAPDGQMSVVLPVSAATSVSLSRFRSHLFEETHLESVWLFRREKTAEPLHKNMVLKLREGKTPGEKVAFYVASDDGTPENTRALESRPYGEVVNPNDASLLLLTDDDENLILEYMKSLPCTFDTFHLKIHTGLTLESRYPELLRDKPVDGAVPLIHPRCLHDGTVTFPLPGVKNQYIIPAIPSLKQPNKNLLLIKRAPAKSDKRKLVCAAYLAGTMMYKHISTHNKLNYIDAPGNEQMDPPFLFGLLGFLSSEAVDRYIRIVSKSAQVNATELASIPLPTAEQLRAIGAKLMAVRVYKPDYCDRVVKSELFHHAANRG